MSISFGTCSWNYDSWVGLVYDEPRRRAVDYLPEYSQKYRHVEVDSFFYRMPTRRDVEEYAAAVDSEFRFVCKAPRDITLTHFRSDAEAANPAFLSIELYGEFLDALDPLIRSGQIAAIILEFEYLNRKKMPSRNVFFDHLGAFLEAAPRAAPIAVECRNGSYLDDIWFSFLESRRASHVFSEKLYLPRIADLYAKYKTRVDSPVVVRLLGGNRAAIETKAQDRWDRVLEPYPDLPGLAAMLADMAATGREVLVDVNNHFEGSAPLTIERLNGYLHR